MMTGRGGRARGRRAPRRKSNAPKSEIGKMLQDYWQKLATVNFNALASGGDIAVNIIDNDAEFGNAILKWTKMTLRPIWDAVDLSSAVWDMRTMYMMVYKQDEDDSTVHTLDSEETIRELQNTKRILRGPWMVSSPEALTAVGFVPPFALHMKPIVLKNFVLDREEDLRIGFTNADAAFGANGQELKFFGRGFVRVIK